MEERLASVQSRLEGALMEDDKGRVCFVQGESVIRRWTSDPQDIERAIEYLEYKAQSLGV